jgi:hypothetical protein
MAGHFMVLTQHLPGGTVENKETPQSELSASEPIVDICIYETVNRTADLTIARLNVSQFNP